MAKSRGKFDWLFDREEFRAGLSWPVAEHYSVKDDKVVVEDAGDYLLTTPLEQPRLFLSFARLAARGRPSDGQILGWVSKHGLLELREEGRRPFYDDEINQAPIGLEDFAKEALEARSALTLYTDLSSGGVQALKKRIRATGEAIHRFDPTSDVDQYLHERWHTLPADSSPMDYNLWFDATAVLRNAVTTKVARVRPALWTEHLFQGIHAERPLKGKSSRAYELSQSWQCPDLLSAMYLQLYLWITDSLPMRRCENPGCQMPFPATRRNKRYCGPTCRSGARTYRYK